jgi:thiol-disulfide isomerase/thioredoxin
MGGRSSSGLLLLVLLSKVVCGSPVEDVDDSNDWPTTGNVVELTSQGIDSQLSEGSWLLEFYAPWCGYCKRLEPVYEEVAKELKAGTSGVSAARIDGSKYKGASPPPPSPRPLPTSLLAGMVATKFFVRVDD